MTLRVWPSINIGLKYVILIGLCLFVMSPVVTAVLGSIRTNGEFMTTPFGLPQKGIQWDNYLSILTNPNFWNSFKNSLLITATHTVLNLVLASLLAFIFTRVDFRGRGLLFNILSLGLLF